MREQEAFFGIGRLAKKVANDDVYHQQFSLGNHQCKRTGYQNHWYHPLFSYEDVLLTQSVLAYFNTIQTLTATKSAVYKTFRRKSYRNQISGILRRLGTKSYRNRNSGIKKVRAQI